MKAWLNILTLSAISGFGFLTAESQCYAASANLVVMSTNPNGVPTIGNQYLLGIQVSGVTDSTTEPGDYDYWVSRFGASSGDGASDGADAVPEPSTLGLLAIAIGCNHRLHAAVGMGTATLPKPSTFSLREV